MGLIKKTKNSQMPPGYLTSNITDNLGNIPNNSKKREKKRVADLGFIELEKDVKNSTLTEDNIYSNVTENNKKEGLPNRPDDVITSTNVIPNNDNDLGNIDIGKRRRKNKIRGKVYETIIKNDNIETLGAINTDSDFITNLSKDLGKVSEQLEAGEFTSNIGNEIKNDSITSSNSIKKENLSGILFEQDDAGKISDNVVNSINDVFINTGKLKNANDLKISEINKEGKQADNIVTGLDNLNYDFKQIEHSVSGEVYEKSDFKQKSVDGSVYSDIKPKTGEVSSLGEIVNSEISIKQELKNENIFTEVSNKNGYTDEIGSLNDYSPNKRESLENQKLYDNIIEIKKEVDLGTLLYDTKVGTNILKENHLYEQQRVPHKSLETSKINLDIPVDKKELDRYEVDINSGKKANNIVKNLDSIKTDKKTNEIKSLGKVY